MNLKRFWKETKHMLALVLAVALFFNGWTNYDFSVLAADELTVTLSAESAVYTGGDLTPDIKSVKDASYAEVAFTAENVTWKNSADEAVTEIINSGTYTVTVEVTESVEDGSGNVTDETHTGTATFTVDQLDLSACTVTADNVTYTGEAIAPVNVVVQSGDTAINSSLYEITNVTDNTNAGTAAFTVNAVSGNSNVIGSKGGSFTIAQKALTDDMVTIEPTKGTANGTDYAQKVTVTVKDTVNEAETTLSANTDYNAVIPEMKTAGTYTIKVTGKGNYSGEVSKSFTVSYAEDENASVTVSGNTLDGDVYTGTVEVTPVQGYTICASETGDYADSLKYEETSDKPTHLYLKDRSGNISQVDFPSFTFDNTSPEISVTAPAEGWANSKEIKVIAEDADYGVFYTKGTKKELASPINKNTDLSGLTKLEGSLTNLTIEENISTETTYYFYAIDKAGHVVDAEATVNKVDVDNPTISVETTQNFDKVNKVYWKNTASLEIPVEAADETSGIKSIEVTGLTDPLAFTEGAEEVEGNLEITTAGDYTITAKDLADNQTTEDFTVKQDTSAPEVTLSEPEGKGKYFDKANQVYWFSSANVTVPLTIVDEAGADDTDKAPYSVIYSTDAEFTTSTEVDVTSDTGEGSAPITLGSSGTKFTYYFKVIDAAGNEDDVQSITLGLDESAPQITEAFLTQLHGDTWINASEFGEENSEHKVEFSVKAEDAESGIQKIAYSSDDGENYTEASFKEENGVYTFSTNEEYPDGTGYSWKVCVTDNVGTSTEKEIEGGKIDTTPPATKAYIKFISDTAGANDTNRGTSDDGKWTSKIWEMASDAWNKIWGKTTINFEVYVQDVTSGIDDISMSYDGTDIDLTKVEGLKAFTEGSEDTTDADSNATGYTVFEGKITCNVNENIEIKDFCIDSLTDVAGNTTSEKVVLNSAENTGIIYLDNVSPKLVSVKIGEESVTDNERYFYNEEKTVTLTIEERFFGQEDKPVYPEVIVSSKVTGGQNITGEFEKDAALSTRTWTHVDGTNQWKAEVRLPEETDKEIEYQITMEAYADPSGNILVEADGVVGVTEEGAFESKIFVIDTLAPELTGYSVNAPTECNINGAAVYKNDTLNDDLTVTFTIDDNETYYDTSKDKLDVELYKKGESTPVKTLKAGDTDLSVEHTNGEREYTYSFGFDGEAATEDEFYVEITYQDAAGNLMVDGREETNSGSMDNGIYTSEAYIIDHVAPVFDISYSDATNVVNASGENASGKQPLAACTAYYNQNIEVTLTFDEKYVNIKDDESLELDHFEFEITKDGTALKDDDIPKITWEHNGTVHEATFKIEADKTNNTTDGNYQFTVKYRDCAENAMVGNEDNADLVSLMSTGTEERTNAPVGIYTSPVLVMDTTAPKITTQYSADPARTANGIDYFKDLNTTLNITVVDRNIRYGELQTALSGMKAYDIDEESIDTELKDTIDDILATKLQCVAGSADPAVWTLNLPLQTEANYEIPVAFTDLAGNEAKTEYTEKVTIDSTAPQLNLSYSVTDPANYLKWGYLFAKGQLNITVTAKDEISGIQYIKFTVIDENGKKTEKTGTFTPTGNTTYSIDIPLSTKDFKGSVLAEVFDYSTNTINQTRGHIIESAEKHSATGKAVIQTITSPSRSVGGVDFYNTDVKFKLTLEDSYSGLASWEYVGGETLKDSATYKKDVGTNLQNEPTKEITYSYVEELTLSASGNNKNDVLVTASYVDNVGYTNEVEQKYNIDITKPEIEVTYDLNEPANGKYYKETRTATVRIRERNFDPSDVEFLITSTDGPMPQISDWSSSGSGDDTWHTCTLAFALDSDYTFTLKFQDMAGNVADYDRVDEFTIDKTIPVATITYDNNNFLNEYYYDAARTATIDILEHNFDPSAIDIMITADGQTTGVPHISAWASNGDHNIATVTFSADAEYTFDIAGLDLALNELEDYTPDHFVIDQTAPELEIFDIEHMSANNGVVRPGIRYHDTNYDKDGTVILMTGYHNGVVEMTGARKLEANGLELKLDDFAYVQEMDDIYTMHAEVYDLAGNSSEATVMFSVNRFGSVYTFDEKTDALIGDNGRYYTNKEQELVITETNVDTLEFKEITCNLNGKLTTLKEGQDYTVSLNGNEATWKQYTYTIKEDNFVEEGTYILTIYSEDRATNTSDNNSKGKKVEFVVDKTNPSVLISGVENNGQYRTNSREMTLDIEDNVRLSQVAVTIDGVETVYDSAQIYEADGKFVMNIGSANHWQEIEVAVTDAAGNEEISEEMRVLVTANIFIQYFMNKPLFYGSLGTLAAFLWWFLVGKKGKSS